MTTSYSEIPLTQGLMAIVDSDLHPVIAQYRWFATEGYAARNYPYRRGRPQRRLFLHHEVLRLRDITIPDGFEVDHWNRNRLDNRTENLRVVTHQVNLRNFPIRRNNTSGYVGVSWDRSRGLWDARIFANGKQHTLGRFPTAEDAAVAYEAARVRLGLPAPYPNI